MSHFYPYRSLYLCLYLERVIAGGSALLAMSHLMIGGRCHDAFQKAFCIVFLVENIKSI
jgi:hypothetical protein